MNKKKINGQFFTITNPFDNQLFYQWIKIIPNFEQQILTEPFAGSNNIVKMINDLGINNQWQCFDIDPHKINNFSKFKVQQKDVIKNFPKSSIICITNPPYLAKNSAIRDKLPFPTNFNYDDLYKISLDIMLQNCDYVAAIITESFITQKLFQDRLFGVISLTIKMFEDTQFPVCLALFIPNKIKSKIKLNNEDFHIFHNNKKIGLFSKIKKKNIIDNFDCYDNNYFNIKFNNPQGNIGLFAIDKTVEESIKFIEGKIIDSKKIKISSRGIIRISLEIDNKIFNNESDIKTIIDNANLILKEYRKSTNDIFLTAFRGLRKDNKYRRRLDFNQAKKIIILATIEFLKDKKENKNA